MAEEKPSRAEWSDEIKRLKKLTIGYGESLGSAGWIQVFKDAIFKFNGLNLGVTFDHTQDLKKANVEARAARGDFDLEYLPHFHKETIRFDGTKAHGFCRSVMTVVQDRARVEKYKIIKAFIYVPAAPTGDRNGKSSVVGDPVKLVIAVHELIHACGLVGDKEHSVDDVFSWPSLRMGNKPSEDRVATLGGTYQFPGKPGEPPRTGHRTVDMPPVFLNDPTANKVRALWA